MPGRDRSGPRGYGPLTGRGIGYCAGPGSRLRGSAYASGPRATGGGTGRGWRNQYYATGLLGWERGGGGWGAPGPHQRRTPVDDVNELWEYASGLEEELNNIRERIQALQEKQRPLPREE